MGLKILRLIFDYSSRGKLADKEFIEKIIDVVVNQKQLGDYVTYLNMKDTSKVNRPDDFIIANYSYREKIISVYLDGIKFCLQEIDEYNYLFRGVELIFYRNLVITQIILHELEHANHFKLMDNNNDMISKLLHLCYCHKSSRLISKILGSSCSRENVIKWFYDNTISDFYYQYYTYAPQERLAEIESYREIIAVISCIKEYIPNLFEFEKACIVENLLRGYREENKGIMCPTVIYLSGTGDTSILRLFDWYDDNLTQCLRKAMEQYSLIDRMTYGLPISTDEHQKVYQKLLTMNKYNKKG